MSIAGLLSLFIMVVGFGIAVVMVAQVTGALFAMLFDPIAKTEPYVQRALRHGLIYLGCYAGGWWIWMDSFLD